MRDIMRAYEESHPWLTFKPDWNFNAKLWMQIGEVQSKCEHIAGTPLQPYVQHQMYAVYLTKGAHATTQIEGNTLSEEEVRKLVDHELKLPPSQEYLGQEVSNVLECFNIVLTDIQEQKPLRLTPERIQEFHRHVAKDLTYGDHCTPGEYRTDSVVVGPGGIYRGAPAEDCEYLVKRLCDWLDEIDAAQQAAPELQFATKLVSAILAHLYLAWIHPFGDGNGRTARMVEFQLLNRAGVPAIAAHLLSDHYNRTRTRYLQVLSEASGHSGRQPHAIVPFIEYAVQGLVDGLRQQIDTIRDQHLIVTWQNFIHEAFRDQGGDTAKRRQWLALALEPNKWTQVSDIRGLTPQLAAAYAKVTQKTVTRDLNALQEHGLIIRTPHGVIPAVGQLQSFIPLRARANETVRA